MYRGNLSLIKRLETEYLLSNIQIDGFLYYYTDNEMLDNTGILIDDKNIFYCDIKAASFTFCKLILGTTHPFVQELGQIKDKTERIKHMTISVYYNKVNVPFTLDDINYFCKYFILTYVSDAYENVNILEFSKDGVIFTATGRKIENEKSLAIDLVKNNLVEVRHEKIDVYARYNNTTILWKDNQVEIKGLYSNPPESIKSLYSSYPNITVDEKLKEAYSVKYFTVLYQSGLVDSIEYFYGFKTDEKTKYIDKYGRFITNVKHIYPPAYLVNIIYPFINLVNSSSQTL